MESRRSRPNGAGRGEICTVGLAQRRPVLLHAVGSPWPSLFQCARCAGYQHWQRLERNPVRSRPGPEGQGTALLLGCSASTGRCVTWARAPAGEQPASSAACGMGRRGTMIDMPSSGVTSAARPVHRAASIASRHDACTRARQPPPTRPRAQHTGCSRIACAPARGAPAHHTPQEDENEKRDWRGKKTRESMRAGPLRPRRSCVHAFAQARQSGGLRAR